jgi:hypothetical protein
VRFVKIGLLPRAARGACAERLSRHGGNGVGTERGNRSLKQMTGRGLRPGTQIGQWSDRRSWGFLQSRFYARCLFIGE